MPRRDPDFPRYDAPPPVDPRLLAPDDEEEVLSVALLDLRLRRAVEGATDGVLVAGEVVGLRVVGSGHAYFTLKDEREEASIDCVMYRSAPIRSKKLLADGARVTLYGRATVYVPRGRLQFVAERARPAGRGALLAAMERLKQRLAEEGLFDPERKRPLPSDPRVIGVITSADGAALHDIVQVAFRRGGVRILLARAPVQGSQAPLAMMRALDLLEAAGGVDAVIIGRGGGSQDDLSAYNDERLVRRVARSTVPVVSAVGHEIDLTFLDLVADRRAATPSQAAELLVPDSGARQDRLAALDRRLRRVAEERLAEASRDLASRGRRLTEAMERRVGREKARLYGLERRVVARHPLTVVAALRARIGPLRERLARSVLRQLASRRQGLGQNAARLSALSPLSVLSRGYAIATDAAGRAICDARAVDVGDRVHVRLHQGTVVTEVLDRRLSSAEPGDEPPHVREES